MIVQLVNAVTFISLDKPEIKNNSPKLILKIIKKYVFYFYF